MQASVPAEMSHYDDTLPYENEDKLLWTPQDLSPTGIENYLHKSHEVLSQPAGVTSLPAGAHTRDDEQV